MSNSKLRNVLKGMWVLLVCFVFLSGCKSNQIVSERNTPQPSMKTNSDEKNDTVLLVIGEYAPYTMEAATNKGFLTEIVEEILKDSGIKYEIRFYPWKRCMEMVESGEAWASFPYGYSDDMARSYDFSSTLISSKHRFYYLKENEHIGDEVQSFSNIKDFTDYTFGGANGYWYGNKSNIEQLGVKSEWANDTDALLKMLHSGRIDFMIEDELVCEAAINRLFPKEIDSFRMLPMEAKIQNYYLILSKQYNNTEEIKEQFNQSLAKLKNNGAIDEILDKNQITH